MARSVFAYFLLFVVLLAGVISSSAQGNGNGTVLNGSAITQVNVTGRIVCSVLGNPLVGFPNEPLVGVNVTLFCDGGETYIGQATTDILGIFHIVVSASSINLFDISGCRVVVTLPISPNCTFILQGSGSLQANLIIASLAQTVSDSTLNLVALPLTFVKL